MARYARRPARGRRTRRGRKRVTGKSTRGMVLYKSFQQRPFPTVFQTKFKTCVQGFIKSGIGLANATLNLKMNSPFLPMYEGVSTGLTNGTYYGSVSPAPSTLYPGGYSSLANANLYTKYRVIGCKILMRFVNQSLSDNGFIVTITPTLVTSPSSSGVALEQPWTKKILCSQGKQNVISNYVTQHQIIGCKKRALEFDLSGQYEGAYNADPTKAIDWVVCFAGLDGASTVGVIPFELELTHYTKLWTANQAGLLET